MNMIYGRPELTKEMGAKRFLEFYYLDTEMVDFCKKNGLDPEGDRNELKNKIAGFMSGGKVGESKFILKPEKDLSIISEDSVIEYDFKYGDRQASFFEEAIGSDFIPYEDFLVWLEENVGKTYGDAVSFWYLIHDNMGDMEP